MRAMIKAILAFLVFSFPVFSGEIFIFDANGVIDPATADYLIKGIEAAEKTGAKAVLIKINTPGGMLKSTYRITDAITASKVPVISYVYPKGARAASAGTFILMASHVAAMAEATNIGTASPIDLKGNKSDEKVTNDAVANMKKFARLYGRNEKWAEEAITKNISTIETDAVKIKAADIAAPDINSLINALDGKKVKIDGAEIKLELKNSALKEIQPTIKHKFLKILSDPNVVYILLLVGIYGIIFELANGGALLLPGIAGGIAIVLAFIGFDSVPVAVGGLLLIALAVIFFTAEAMTPGFGLLFTGGIISMVAGSLILFPGSEVGGQWAPSLWVIITMTLLTAAFFALVTFLVIKAQKKKAVTGRESLVGLKGVAQNSFSAESGPGVVNVGGEEWQATADEAIEARDIIEVVEVNGLKLKVKKIPRKKEE